jgi:hypothetical protein
MALGYDAQRQLGIPGRSTPATKPAEPGRGQPPNSVSASQARAARRREALSNQQAVSAWLRELSRPGR